MAIKNNLRNNIVISLIAIIATGIIGGSIWGSNYLLQEYYYKQNCIEYAKNHDYTFLALKGKSKQMSPVGGIFKSTNNEEILIPINEILKEGTGRFLKWIHGFIMFLAFGISTFIGVVIVIRVFKLLK